MRLSREAESAFRVQSYGARPSIEGLARIELQRFNDEGGSLIELLRLQQDPPRAELAGFQLAQVNYSCLAAGTIKAFHVHRRQTDVWFVPPEDRVLLVVVDLRAQSPTEGQQMRMVLGDGRSALLRIPPGVAHGCRNLGDRPACLMYFTDLQFSADPADCDEGRLPWDYLGPEVWEIPRE